MSKNTLPKALIWLLLAPVLASASSPLELRVKSVELETTEGSTLRALVDGQTLSLKYRSPTAATIDCNVDLRRPGPIHVRRTSIAEDNWLEGEQLHKSVVIVIAIEVSESSEEVEKPLVDEYRIRLTERPRECSAGIYDDIGNATRTAQTSVAET